MMLLALAFASDWSMLTTEAWRSTYVVTAYRDNGGYTDWNCGSNTYSGHGGTDIAIYGSFTTMALGVDITATSDGTVYATNDGEPDTCTSGACGGGGGYGNYVAIREASGRITYYAHMRTWSVAVSSGEAVVCGQKLGEVGSSGNSTGPHVHLEPRSGSSFDPFSGPCGSSSSLWVDQGSYNDLPGITCGASDVDGDGYTESEGDCNDRDPSVHPAASEYCDGVDNNCDGSTDGSDAVDAVTYYQDADGDGYGNPNLSQRLCSLTAGWVLDNTDCNDTYDLAYPGAPELCDFVDNDCDTDIDEGYDEDADGYRTCDGDCDDSDPDIHREAPEVVDNIDNDCDWRVDEGSTTYDDDRDGWTEVAGDCDDQNSFSFPAAPELPNLNDDDCDGLIDEGTVFSDDDTDGWTEAQGDCDDTDPVIYPGAAEAGDGEDGDCDGTVDEGTVIDDQDHDGWTERDGDCDDLNLYAFPGAVERIDGTDNDCDNAIDDQTDLYDDDGDTFSEDAGDCDDTDANINPGAPETTNLRDDDCDYRIDDQTETADDDGDGWTEADGDCNDRDAAAFPGGAERANGTDDDCDGLVDDQTDAGDDDGDGFSENDGDCDDALASIYPGATEFIDNIDQNCNRLLDDTTDVFDDDGDGWTEQAGDCDDGNVYIRPGAMEYVDGLDNNCDGESELAQGWQCDTGGSFGMGAALMAAVLVLRRGSQRRRR